MNYKLMGQAILSFLFLKKDKRIDWIKVIRNVLLFYIGIYYIDFFYLSNDTSRMWMDTGDGGMVVLGYIVICYISAFFILCLRLFKNKIFWLLQIFCLAALFFFYRLVISFCITPICLLNPLFFIPLVWGIFLFFKGGKYSNQTFIIFVLIPSAVIITDDIIGRIKIAHFYDTCIQETPKAEYHPIYLPKEYFHKETVNGNTVWKPNIVECRWGSNENPQNYNKGIYRFFSCDSILSEESTAKYLEKDFIVLCTEEQANKLWINRLNKDLTTTNLARLYSLKTTWQNNWLSVDLKRATYYCYYNNKSYLSWDYNFSDQEASYDNYIKMLPDTETTANPEVP